MTVDLTQLTSHELFTQLDQVRRRIDANGGGRLTPDSSMELDMLLDMEEELELELENRVR